MSALFPDPIATKKRCQFTLPNCARYYDCRRMGKYVLDGKGFCAPHYKIAWELQHPLFGPQHVWELRKGSPYETCTQCGTVRHHEGFPQDPCRGKLNRIVLWAS